MKRPPIPHKDTTAIQVRRIRWTHGLKPNVARVIAGLAYGEGMQ